MRLAKDQKGVSLIAAIFIIVILAFMGVVFLTLFTATSSTSINELQSSRSFYVAEGGMEYILKNSTFPNYSMGGSTVILGAGNFTTATPTYLTAVVNIGNTTVTVNSTSIFPSSGKIVIDSEVMTYTATTATTFTVPAGATSAHANGNAVYPVTTVTVNPGAAGTTINVASTTGFVIPGVIKIDSEYIYCTGTTATTFTTCTRGYKSTTAAAHAVGSSVYQYIITSTGTVGDAQRVVRVGADSSGAIAYDNATRARDVGVTSLTWSHTVSGSNRILIVGVSIRYDNNQTVSGVTYAVTQPLTRIGYLENGTSVRVELWQLVAPATGANNITVTLSPSANVVGGAVSLTGVEQSDPSVSGFRSGSDTTPWVTIATVANNSWVVDALASRNTAAAVGAGQTERWNWFSTGQPATRVLGAGSTRGPVSPAGNVTMSWTLSPSVDWAIGAVAVRPVAGGVTLLSWQEVFN